MQSAENMSVSGKESLFFISPPDLQKLCAVKVVLSNQVAETEIRSTQLKMCRQLLFMYQELLTSPVPGLLSQIWVVMTIPFYKSGKLQAYTEKHGAKVVTPQKVVPAILQICLSYSVTARLSPSWNKAGHLLVQVLDFNVSETQLCISIEACTVRLPPPKLNDFDISENILKNFDDNKHAIIEGHSILSNWCYVLPSMKMGQITSILHTVSPDCPFRSREDFQLHWDSMYGYSLPEDCGNMEIYCTIYFKLIGERLFTYPLSCIRSQPVQFFPRVDVENVLKSFLLDLKSKLPHICGFPIKMTNKPCYYTQELIRPSLQGNKDKTPNLITRKMFRASQTEVPSIKPTLAQSPLSTTLAFDHKMELSANQPKPSIFLNLINQQPDYKDKGTYDRESQIPFEACGHKSSNIQAQDVIPDYQNKNASKIIPIFKSRLMQMNKNIPKTVNQKKKQHIGTESKLFASKSCVTQVNKLNLGKSEKKRTKNNRASVHIGNENPSSFRSLPDLHTKSNFCLSKGTSSNVSLGECKFQFSSDSVFQLSCNNSDLIRNVTKIQKKENLASQDPLLVLGKGHESLPKKRQFYIFESDTEMEDSQIPQQSVNPIKEVGLNICRLVSNRSASKSKRKFHQQSPEVQKSLDIYPGLFNTSVNQGKGLSKSKPKKSQMILNI
uniref:Chromosome 18 open reading frame 63 n=1 Tax=Monodelphis domestica TaxID=13616 RepID=F6PNM0_MONDO